MPIFKRISILLTLPLIFSVSTNSENLKSEQKSHIITAKIERIVFPFRIEIRDLKTDKRKIVKLYGVELNFRHECLNKTQEEEIKKAVLKILKPLKGRTVKIIPKGNDVAIILLPTNPPEDLGFELVDSGYACIDWKTANDYYILALESATMEKRGLWNKYFQAMKCLCYF